MSGIITTQYMLSITDPLLICLRGFFVSLTNVVLKYSQQVPPFSKQWPVLTEPSSSSS